MEGDFCLTLCCPFLRPIHWEAFIQQLHLLAENSSALKNSEVTSPEAILQVASDICITPQNSKLRSVQKCHSIMDSSEGLSRGIGRSTIWLPLDLVLEDAMNVTQVNATSSVEVITGKVDIVVDHFFYQLLAMHENKSLFLLRFDQGPSSHKLCNLA